MEVKLCRECRHSMPARLIEPESEWNLRCMNPDVNSRDPLVLSGTTAIGSNARGERTRKWFALCGIKGKLWEEKQ